jgi:hypothetical protein
MCYSKESSLYTSSVSFAAIVYLVSSGIPHFQWLGVALAGLCAMQFAEYLLWSEEPDKSCTERNKLITSTAVPAALFAQGLSVLYGSLFVYPWKTSSDLRKFIIVAYTLAVAAIVYVGNFYNPSKECTIVTEDGHLDWGRNTGSVMSWNAGVLYYGWAFVIAAPFILWNRSFAFLAAFLALPLFGFLYGRYATDSQASIWCYYTSWSSIIAAGGLLLKHAGYDHLRV